MAMLCFEKCLLSIRFGAKIPFTPVGVLIYGNFSARFDGQVLNWSVESFARELAVWQRALRPSADFVMSAVFCEDPMHSFEVIKMSIESVCVTLTCSMI